MDENPYIIRNTQDFLSILIVERPLETDKDCLYYDAESFFTNIPVRETINYILAEIYGRQKLKPICSKQIFKRLSLKLFSFYYYLFQYKIL